MHPQKAILLCFLVVFQTAQAQTSRLKFEHITTEQGLSRSNVTCIFRDSRGFMWFGTQDGLNQYDSYRINVYRRDKSDPHSLSNNYVMAITEDHQGNLWVATNGGLNMFDRATGRFIRYLHDEQDERSIPGDMISAVREDKGNIWIGMNGQGLVHLNQKTGRFQRFDLREGPRDNAEKNHVQKIFRDKQDHLWIGTRGGLILFDEKEGKTTPFFHDDDDPKSLSNNFVTDIFQDSRGLLWIATYGGGLNLFDPATRTFTRASLHDDFLFSISEDDEGRLWIATEHEGIILYDHQQHTVGAITSDDFLQDALSSNALSCVYRDPLGSFWIGTYDAGVNVWRKGSGMFTLFRHSPYPNSLSDNKILCIYEDLDTNIWIGTDGGGLNLLDKKIGTFRTFRHQEGNRSSIAGDYVLSILQDSEGDLWVGTFGNGLTRWNRKKNTFHHYPGLSSDPSGLLGVPNIWFITEDRDKNLWFGHQEFGLSMYNRHTRLFTHFSPADRGPYGDHIQFIFHDRSGRRWIGTSNNGLKLLHPDETHFERFKYIRDVNSISSNNIQCMYEDNEGNFWIGTDDGLNFLDTSRNVFTVYHTEDGLPSDFIAGILPDDSGNLWISTHNGLSRFDPKKRIFRNFGISDGLQSSEFTAPHCKARSGALYFGGLNGFNEFFPANIRDIPYDPPIVLTDFLIFNKHVPVSDAGAESPLSRHISESGDITLAYDQSVFTFEFASLNYVPAEKKRYRYRLEGFDETWNDVGTQRTATYTSLDPGEYVFRVRGLRNDGNFSEKAASVGVIILPPFWRTWWFTTLVLATLAGSIFLPVYSRINSMTRQRIKLEKAVRERTKEVLRQKEDLRRQRDVLTVTNEETEKARHEAEKANRAKSVFLATMSHEIRTPMNGVVGMASLLSETNLSEEQKEYTENIQKSAEKLLLILNNILDFSKIESGSMELEKADFDLRACVEGALDVFSGRSVKRGLDLNYQIESDVPLSLNGDSLRLRQILINLVGNAIKFTSQGEVFVGVRVSGKEGDRTMLEFRVRDTGIGIPEEKADKLFKPFSQVDSSTTRKYGGSGLGLAISQKLVHLMGGTIAVESTPGQGTVLIFTIPASPGVVPPVELDVRPEFEGKRILVVDDNPTSRVILKAQLEKWKLVPTLASSGEEALSMISSAGTFDLVLTDMAMPAMDGAALAAEIHRLHPVLPVILLSSGDYVREELQRAKFAGVLAKPVKQKVLYNNLVQIFGGSRVISIPRAAPKLSAAFAAHYPLRILVAEDNVVNQKLILRVLTKLGYEPVLVTDGVSAVAATREEEFDLVLMDVLMPGMDGLEATRLIRASVGKQILIVAMTANAMQGDREVCLKAGMDDYISKPVRLEVLTGILEKCHGQLVQQIIPGQATGNAGAFPDVRHGRH